MKAKTALLVMATLVSLGVNAQSAKSNTDLKYANDSLKTIEERFKSAYKPLLDEVKKSCNVVVDFVDSGDGGLADPISGLTWYRCPAGQTWDGNICAGEKKLFTWYSAMIAAKSSTLLGKNDWRLPTINELESITRKNESCRQAVFKEVGEHCCPVKS